MTQETIKETELGLNTYNLEEILRIYKNKQVKSDEVGSYTLKLNVEE